MGVCGKEKIRLLCSSLPLSGSCWFLCVLAFAYVRIFCKTEVVYAKKQTNTKKQYRTFVWTAGDTFLLSVFHNEPLPPLVDDSRTLCLFCARVRHSSLFCCCSRYSLFSFHALPFRSFSCRDFRVVEGSPFVAGGVLFLCFFVLCG